MKRLIASDLHGSLPYCRQLDLYRQEGAEQLVLLGDLAYPAPTTPATAMTPRGSSSSLNPLAQEILWVEGNCDYGVQALGALSHDLPLRRAGLGGPAGLSHPRPPVRPRQSPRPEAPPRSSSPATPMCPPGSGWRISSAPTPAPSPFPGVAPPRAAWSTRTAASPGSPWRGEPYHWEALPPSPQHPNLSPYGTQIAPICVPFFHFSLDIRPCMSYTVLVHTIQQKTQRGCLPLDIVVSNRATARCTEQIADQIKGAILRGRPRPAIPSPPSVPWPRPCTSASSPCRRPTTTPSRKRGFIETTAGKGCYVAPQNQDFYLEEQQKKIEESLPRPSPSPGPAASP